MHSTCMSSREIVCPSRGGYVTALEYLPAAAEGDKRLILLTGMPEHIRGSCAAFRRARTGDDICSDFHADGRSRRADVNYTMIQLADMARPRMVEGGMLLV